MKIACSSFDLSLNDLEGQLVSFNKLYGLKTKYAELMNTQTSSELTKFYEAKFI